MPYAKEDKYILYKSAVNAPCCPFIPGKIFIIECVVDLLTAVKSGKVLLNVAILLRSDKPETFNVEAQVTFLFNQEHAGACAEQG